MPLGIRARIDVVMVNPCDITVNVGNPGPSAPTVQVQLNEVILGEYSTLTAINLPFIAGHNVLELITSDGGLTCIGKFLGSLGTFSSLFSPGSDPFSVTSGGALSPTSPD